MGLFMLFRLTPLTFSDAYIVSVIHNLPLVTLLNNTATESTEHQFPDQLLSHWNQLRRGIHGACFAQNVDLRKSGHRGWKLGDTDVFWKYAYFPIQ